MNPKQGGYCLQNRRTVYYRIVTIKIYHNNTSETVVKKFGPPVKQLENNERKLRDDKEPRLEGIVPTNKTELNQFTLKISQKKITAQ